MKLLLTRHGETEENRQNILQGWSHGHLSEKGKKQANLLGKRLKDIEIDYIYTSDLKRASDTASIIAQYHSESRVIKEKLLRERNLGYFQGKKVLKGWNNAPAELLSLTRKPRGGESFLQVVTRLKKFYNIILKKHAEETVLIVGHVGAMCLFEGIIQHKNIEDSLKLVKLKNTAVSEYAIDKKGNYKLIYRNSAKHL